MKTINDLVNRLNNYVAYGEFYIKKGKNDNYLLYVRSEVGDDSTVFDFAKERPYWSIYPPLGAMNNQVQEDIMNFAYNTDKEHWFDEPEKKYNVVIGEDVVGSFKTAYRNVANGAMVNNSVDEGDLALDDFIFTENEVEDLKSKVSEQAAKIIDIGKVEVKND